MRSGFLLHLIASRLPESQQLMSTDARLLSLSAAAIYLSVTDRHLRRLVAERRIAVIKERKLLRFDMRDLDAWIDANRRDAIRVGQW